MIPTTYKKMWAYLKAQSKAFDERLDKNIKKRAKESDERSEKRAKEFDEQLAKSRLEFDESIAKSRLELDESIAKSRIELDASLAKTRLEFQQLLAEQNKKSAKDNEDLKRRIAELTDSLGEFAEEMVKPQAIELFRERNIVLDEVYQRIEKKDDNEQKLYEVDILLVNTIYAVAIEVKNTLRQKNVENHLKQLEKIKQYPVSPVKGKTVLGAVAGVLIKPEVEQFAIKHGLFVIKQVGNKVRLINPPQFKPKEWIINQK